MELRRWLLAAVLTLSICPLLAAQSITYTFKGKVGPILSGTDPLGANGQGGELTAVVSTSLTPTSTTTTSATYTLPAGAITVYLGGKKYTTDSKSSLKYNFPATGREGMIFVATISVSGLTATVVGSVSLDRGSFPASITEHPAAFTPTPQKLTAATTAGGPGSQVSYSAALIGKTVLGLSGSASN